jgi:L-lactate dehydrogenase
MKRQVAIIGVGRVGASIAISTLISGLADEVLLHDLRHEVAEGEAMDLAHGATFFPAASVRTASIENMVGADVVVVTAGRGGRPGESRLALLRDNAAVISAIGRQLSGCTGTIIVVSNPVDVLTYIMTRVTGLPPSRVLGTGTMLDTARLRQAVGQLLDMDPHSIHANVVGEHGDSEVVLWSSASIGGVAIRDWPGWDVGKEPAIAEQVRRAAYEIIQRKGVTNHAIGLVTADLLRSVLRGERRVLTVSRVQEGALGLRDVALSLPAVVGCEGAADIVVPDMSDDEGERLERSAVMLRGACHEIATIRDSGSGIRD